MPSQPVPPIQSDHSLPPSRLGRLLVPLALLAVGQFWLLRGRSTGQWAPSLPTAWSLAQVLAVCGLLMVLWRVVRAASYRPVPGLPDEELPEVTVIVPAYNEGRQVYETLRSIVAGDYPAEKLHVVAVDDGSKDDTWTWMKRAAARYGSAEHPIATVRCARNRGKRHALYEGFTRARGTVVVTIDSDSEICRDTLRNLVSPFVVDARVGAVAGNVRVLRGKNFIARMLDVSFTYAFEFMRAGESAIDTVTCCPGALSAFRRSLVDRYKDTWLRQTFLGRPAAIGEDRAMTNLVLKSGHLVRFQSNAVVLTEVPRRLPQLARMYLRWARSNVRETIALAGFAFTRFRPSSALGMRIDLVWAIGQMVLGALAFPALLTLAALHPTALGWVALAFLASGAFPAAVYALTRGGRQALWAFPYALYSALFLSWITPYSLLTPHRSAWLTRGKTTETPVELESGVSVFVAEQGETTRPVPLVDRALDAPVLAVRKAAASRAAA